MLKGRLVSEAELDAWPASHVVALGPLEAFEDPARFGLPLEVADDGTVTVAGHELRAKRTGIFLRDAGQTRFAYTGLSFEGFQDVFTVPTGNYACTITTGRGRIGIQGNWSPGGLVLEVLPFLEPYPDAAAVRALQVPSGAITIAPVLSGPEPAGLDPKFKAWLDGFVAQQRVLYFGESHWNTGVNHVFLRSVEHLLRSGRLRTVLLELNYSFSGFYDYYVTEPDAARAKEFLEERLHPLMSSASTLELLEILRA